MAPMVAHGAFKANQKGSPMPDLTDHDATATPPAPRHSAKVNEAPTDSIVAIGQQLRRLYAQHHRLDLAFLAATDKPTSAARSAAADAAWARIEDLATRALCSRPTTLADAAVQAGIALAEIEGLSGYVGAPGSDPNRSLKAVRSALAGLVELLSAAAGLRVDRLGPPGMRACVARWRPKAPALSKAVKGASPLGPAA